MTRLTESERRALVAEAARAPSVHNIQPARWRFEDDSVRLFRANDRTLPVADPSGHDVEASLGAAFEGMVIALSRLGRSLGDPVRDTSPAPPGLTSVVRAAVRDDGIRDDPLAEWVMERRAFRGRFESAKPGDDQAIASLSADDVTVVPAGGLPALASMHDAATWHFESRPAYHRELWSWLRLSRRNPNYGRDGLNADCLALSTPERLGASVALRPAVFRVLASLGVARHLITEAPQVRSAGAALLFTPLRATTAFDVGRRFYRLWLEVTALGFHLVPMSASADDETIRTQLAAQYRVADDRRIANVFRVGRAPHGAVARSPRLPVEELLG